MIEIPKGVQVVTADPPWFYNSRAHHKTRFRGGACGHYDLMKTEDICKIPVASFCADDAILFIWVTFPTLLDAFKVIEAWEFQYKTAAFAWFKKNKKADTPFFGVGYYTKSNVELCLLATRGKVLKPATNEISQVIVEEERPVPIVERIGEHSEKPTLVYTAITSMYPTQKKIELFARQQREGWTCLGGDLGVKLTPNGIEEIEELPMVETKRIVSRNLFDDE